MKPSFVVTPEAKNDLLDILLDVAQDSPTVAERLRHELYAALRTLGRSPGMGHHRENLLDRRYRFWNFYSWVVCYAWKKWLIQSAPLCTALVI